MLRKNLQDGGFRMEVLESRMKKPRKAVSWPTWQFLAGKWTRRASLATIALLGLSGPFLSEAQAQRPRPDYNATAETIADNKARMEALAKKKAEAAPATKADVRAEALAKSRLKNAAKARNLAALNNMGNMGNSGNMGGGGYTTGYYPPGVYAGARLQNLGNPNRTYNLPGLKHPGFGMR